VRDLESLLLNKSIAMHVVVGPASNQSHELLNLSNKHHNQIVIHENILEMSDFLENVDLAISSVGVVAFEIASMGIPAIHVTGVEKELETGESMSNLGVSINIGMYNSLSTQLYSTVLKLINNKFLRKRMRDNCFKNFDLSITKKLIELIAFNTKGETDDKLHIV
jgi:spore coat polysaccharide biosynthesis predicted glycosyltransferase SpsG